MGGVRERVKAAGRAFVNDIHGAFFRTSNGFRLIEVLVLYNLSCHTYLRPFSKILEIVAAHRQPAPCLTGSRCTAPSLRERVNSRYSPRNVRLHGGREIHGARESLQKGAHILQFFNSEQGSYSSCELASFRQLTVMLSAATRLQSV